MPLLISGGVMRKRCLSCVVVIPLAFLPLIGGENKKPARFTERLIADKYGYAFGVAAADLDGDGDLDLTSCDTTNNALYWFENDGKGTFRRHYIQKDETGWFERHAIGDI